ncbi:hypothetical protein [Microbacterium aquimaris]|uniref:DUF3558 domain-containing protein n=1 Tax=Microbacterium aquimaris TaxID=459816 RepID=A0ABU5N5T3_9MICO|nr:hypothetical protein [Microbacterium aquimaris]MDZ8161277.1 hypothetical protein [Microbacterium aquimaris]
MATYRNIALVGLIATTLVGCAPEAEPAPTATPVAEVTPTATPTPTPDAFDTVTCDDLLAAEDVATVLGEATVAAAEPTYLGAVPLLGGTSCTWEDSRTLPYSVTVLNRAVVPDSVVDAGYGPPARFATMVEAGTNWVIVEGYDEAANEALAGLVSSRAAAWNLADEAITPPVAVDCEAIATTTGAALGQDVRLIGTDAIPHGPTWLSLVDHDMADYCPMNAFVEGASAEDVNVLVLSGLAAPADPVGDVIDTGSDDASATINDNGTVLVVTAWNGDATVTVSSSLLGGDSALAIANDVLESF